MTNEIALHMAETALAFSEGRTVEQRHRYSLGDIWFDTDRKHDWNFQTYEYRIKKSEVCHAPKPI